MLHIFKKIFKKNIGIPSLAHPMRYLYQIKKLVSNAKGKGLSQLFEQSQDSVQLFNFCFDADILSTALATDIRKEQYHLSQPQQRLLKVKNKQRLVYDYPLTDKIVLGVLSQVLNELLTQVMSKHSYAFQIGKSPVQVIQSLANYIKSFPNNISEFYLFRTDFVSYSDEIDVRENSIFWTNLEELFTLFSIKPTQYQWKLIKDAIRPECYNLNGLLQCNLAGVPTGTAMVTFTNNFYAYKIDHIMEKYEDIFYARYCDDIILCHPDPSYLKEKSIELKTLIHSLSLRTNPKKEMWNYFTTSGKACDNPEFTGVNAYEYLGYRVRANGMFTLSKARQRKILKTLFYRISNTYKSASFKNKIQAGEIICHAINNSYTNPSMAEPGILSLINETTDHAQLKHLDYLIALRIAETLSGIRGTKAFRHYPYKKIRAEFGLRSLIVLRNKGVQ